MTRSPDSMSSPHKGQHLIDGRTVGIYCLANDTVLEWMIALLESLRTFEPEIELSIIPFDDNILKLSKLATRYRFTFLHDDTLGLLDKLGTTVDPRNQNLPIHPFRKFAAFWGPFDHFLFLDADIVVLGKFQDVFRAYLRSKCDFMYFDRDMDMAYKSGAFRALMIAEHSAVGFNSGAFVSSRDMFSMKDLRELAGDARSIRENFVSRYEQSFFNYCVDIKGLNKQQYCEVVPHASCSNWAKWPLVESPDGAYHTRKSGYDSAKSLLFVHWAGFRQGPLMPHRKLFLRYRHRGKPPILRLSYYGLDLILLAWVILDALARKACVGLRNSGGRV